MHSSVFVNWPQIWVFCKLDFMCDLCTRRRLLCFVWGSASCHLETPSFQSTVWSLLWVTSVKQRGCCSEFQNLLRTVSTCLRRETNSPTHSSALCYATTNRRPNFTERHDPVTRLPLTFQLFDPMKAFFMMTFFFFILGLQFLQVTQCPLKVSAGRNLKQ